MNPLIAALAAANIGIYTYAALILLYLSHRFGAKREHLTRSAGLLPESQGQNHSGYMYWKALALDVE
jgi:hypothetical protein